MKILKTMAVSALIALAVCSSATAELDLSKAITVGSGPKTVVEFTDPDCPHCRKAARYFEGRSDVTRHIFFYPLSRHPRAKEKARFVLSQQNKGKAYHEVMAGKYDAPGTLPATAEGVRLQELHVEIAKKSKVDSTPTFMISGRIIEGFELKKIEEALGARP